MKVTSNMEKRRKSGEGVIGWGGVGVKTEWLGKVSIKIYDT